jgi:hypothetical protein
MKALSHICHHTVAAAELATAADFFRPTATAFLQVFMDFGKEAYVATRL